MKRTVSHTFPTTVECSWAFSRSFPSRFQSPMTVWAQIWEKKRPNSQKNGFLLLFVTRVLTRLCRRYIKRLLCDPKDDKSSNFSHQVQWSSGQMTLGSQQLWCCWAGSGLLHMDTDRIILTWSGVYIWQVWTGGKASSCHDFFFLFLRLMASLAWVKATWSPQGEIEHWGDVEVVRGRNIWAMLLLSVPVTRRTCILFVMDVLYFGKTAHPGFATLRQNEFYQVLKCGRWNDVDSSPIISVWCSEVGRHPTQCMLWDTEVGDHYFQMNNWRPSIPTQNSHKPQLLTIKVSCLIWTKKYWSTWDKPTLSAYTSPAVKPCTSSRVHEAAVLRRQASVHNWSSGPNNALEWTGKVDFCCPQPLFHTGKPSGSVFCFQILLRHELSPRPRGPPLTNTTHTHNLLDTLPTMSSLPSPQSPPVAKFGTGYTLM